MFVWTSHFSRPIILQLICCCVNPLVIPCVKDTTILHAMQGSVNILCSCDSHSSVLMLMCISQFARDPAMSARDPAMSEYFACASSNDNAWSRCFSNLRTIWRVSHPRNGPNLATYKPVYLSRRCKHPLTLLLRFKAMLTLETFLYFDQFILMFPCRLFVQGIQRSFAKNGHPRLLSQCQICHDQTVPRFSGCPFVSVHKQTEKLALNIECHKFYKLHSRQPVVLQYDTWQPLITCSRAGREGLFIVPYFLSDSWVSTVPQVMQMFQNRQLTQLKMAASWLTIKVRTFSHKLSCHSCHTVTQQLYKLIKYHRY